MAATSQASKPAPKPAAKRAKRPKLYGKEKPRVYTPPLRPLEPRSPETERWTLGYDVIDFAAEVLGIDLFPWQKWLLVHMLELLDDGSLRFRTVVVLIARQNGKSTLSQVLAIWIICVWGWPLVLGTAQDLETAEEVWQGAIDMVEESEELSPLIDRIVKVNGKKALEIIREVEDFAGKKRREKGRYKVKAANRKAGRGFTGNLILLDELREHQTWDAWGAITKTTMAQLEALVLALSNAGDVTSVVLRYLRTMGHEGAGDPDGICAQGEDLAPSVIDLGMDEDPDGEDDEYDDEEFEQDADTLGLFEYSAPPGCSKWDREGWAQANPSVGWNPGFTERTIAAACKTDPEWVFRTECLCQWSDGILEGPFPPGVWEEGQNVPEQGPDGSLQIAENDKIVTNVDVGISQSADREFVYVAFAGYRMDGRPQVEIVAARKGTTWTAGYLMDPKRRGRINGVTGQTKGAQESALLEDLLESYERPDDLSFDIEVHQWQGTDLTNGWSRFMDAVTGKKLRHHRQPPLDLAATTAVLKQFSGGTTLPDHKASPADVAPLMAATAAYWLLTRREQYSRPASPPPASVNAQGAVQTDVDLPDYDEPFDASDIGSIGF